MSEASSQSPMTSRSATFYPLLNCNAKCPFCTTRIYTEHGVVSAEDYKRGSGKLRLVNEYTFSLEQAKQSYRELREQGVDAINIQGGEPTVYEPLADLIRYGKDELKLREQVVVTNGRMFKDAAYAKKIVESGVSTIAFSIFGATAKMHDESLGVPGSYADMLAGVRNVVALRTGDHARLQVTGQIILHGRNYRSLPEILQFWYAQGIRFFGIRLLRETGNISDEERPSWFFDLRELKGYLQRTLDWAVMKPDLEVVFGEIFACLLDEDYLGFILGELQSSHRLWKSKVLANRHVSEVTSYISSRTVARSVAHDPCDTCDINQQCVKVEEHYQQFFTGCRVSLSVRDRFERLAAGEVTAANFMRLRNLLSHEQALDTFEIPETSRIDLHKKLVAFSDGDEGRELPSPMAVTLKSLRRIQDIREEWKRRTVSFIKLSEFSPNTLFRGINNAFLADLIAKNEPPKSDKLAFLQKAECLLVEPLFAVFAGRVERGPRRGNIPFLAILYNDYCATEAPITRLLGTSEPVKGHA